MFFNTIKISGGNGSTKEQAIIINAHNEKSGVDVEYNYLNLHYPEYELDEQTLILDQDKQYDIMSIILAEGSKIEIWFNITDFYGRKDE